MLRLLTKGQPHSQLGKFSTLDEPVTALHKHRSEELGKPNWWPPRPVRKANQPRSVIRAEAPKGLLVDKWANRHAGE